MKDWFTWMLVMVGLLLVFAFWPVQRPIAQAQDQPPSQNAGAVHRAAHPVAAPAPAAQPTFGEYPCSSSDCHEHKAGFRWAEDHAIMDPDNCTGISGAFVEGCRVYAQQHAPATWMDPAA